jgi:hypothetical protein
MDQSREEWFQQAEHRAGTGRCALCGKVGDWGRLEASGDHLQVWCSDHVAARTEQIIAAAQEGKSLRHPPLSPGESEVRSWGVMRRFTVSDGGDRDDQQQDLLP